jgi:hypothetical protein
MGSVQYRTLRAGLGTRDTGLGGDVADAPGVRARPQKDARRRIAAAENAARVPEIFERER